MRAKQVAYGLTTSLPLLGGMAVRLRRNVKGGEGGGANSARYCYSVWLRHLVRAWRNGLDCRPQVALEFGPGDSLGVGLAALLSGAARFYAVDVVQFAGVDQNLRIFDELVGMFEGREAIPDNDEFPEVRPLIDDYDFPHGILDAARLGAALSAGRIELIRDSILKLPGDGDGGMIGYKTPWSDLGVVARESVDLIYSQAVMEHIDDLPRAYRAMNYWLKPGGYVSHAIDFRSHRVANGWNGHWAYSDLTWRLIRGKRPYLINRQPMSAHLGLLRAEGFVVREEARDRAEPAVPRGRLARGFRGMTEDDLTTATAFIQAQKGQGFAGAGAGVRG